MDWLQLAGVFAAIVLQFLALWGLHSKQVKEVQKEAKDGLREVRDDVMRYIREVKDDVLREVHELRRDVGGVRESHSKLEGTVNGLERRIQSAERGKP